MMIEGGVDGELSSDQVGWTGSAATRAPHKNTPLRMFLCV